MSTNNHTNNDKINEQNESEYMREINAQIAAEVEKMLREERKKQENRNNQGIQGGKRKARRSRKTRRSHKRRGHTRRH